MKIFLLAILFGSYAMSSPSDSIQLQQLISKSQTQIDDLKEILNTQKDSSASLQKATQILNALSLGIGQSIQKYRGTPAYQKALLDIQSKGDFTNVLYDAKEVKDSSKKLDQAKIDQSLKDIEAFQKESVKANQDELARNQSLEEALQSAQPGLIPKIQTQAQLESWKASIRLSAQLTQLLSTVQAMREEMRGVRGKDDGSNFLSLVLEGANIQNEKQKGDVNVK